MGLQDANNYLETVQQLYANNSHDPNNAKLISYASTEYLAHVLPYALLEDYQDNLAVKVYEEDGSVVDYLVNKLSSSSKALDAFVLIPATFDQEAREFKVHVLFPGVTNCAGVQSFLEHDNPGEQTAAVNMENIVLEMQTMLKAYLTQGRDKYKLFVSGHSQGSAFAQYFAMELLKNIRVAQNPSISELRLNLSRPVGVDAGALAESSGNISLVAWKSVNLGLRVIKVAGDLIQEFGSAVLFADTDPQYADVELYIHKCALGWHHRHELNSHYFGFLYRQFQRAVGLHTTRIFDELPCNLEYSMFSNKDLGGREWIKYELARESCLFNNCALDGVKYLFASCIGCGTRDEQDEEIADSANNQPGASNRLG